MALEDPKCDYVPRFVLKQVLGLDLACCLIMLLGLLKYITSLAYVSLYKVV